MQLRNKIVWKEGDAMGLASMGGAHARYGGIQRVSGDRETRRRWSNGVAEPGTLTFSAFFAASASERLSKLTKPTGCGGRTGVISQVPGEHRGEPLTPGNGGMVAPFGAAPTCLEVSLMRDPSYPCKESIKKGFWWRSPQLNNSN